jgi:hypothetical protein
MEGNIAQIFAISWFLFALAVIGGNLSAIIFQKQDGKIEVNHSTRVEKQRKFRSYH